VIAELELGVTLAIRQKGKPATTDTDKNQRTALLGESSVAPI
jgi:hypothetical protein